MYCNLIQFLFWLPLANGISHVDTIICLFKKIRIAAGENTKLLLKDLTVVHNSGIFLLYSLCQLHFVISGGHG